MRKLILTITILTFFYNSYSQVSVRGYYRKNGTYVEPYTRSYPKKNKNNSIYSIPESSNSLNHNSNYFSNNSRLRFNLGFQYTYDEPIGGYMITKINKLLMGLEAGGGSHKSLNIENTFYDLDNYWSLLIGFRNLYIGTGQIKFYNSEILEERISENIYSLGYIKSKKYLSYKIGFQYSKNIKINPVLGIGFAF